MLTIKKQYPHLFVPRDIQKELRLLTINGDSPEVALKKVSLEYRAKVLESLEKKYNFEIYPLLKACLLAIDHDHKFNFDYTALTSHINGELYEFSGFYRIREDEFDLSVVRPAYLPLEEYDYESEEEFLLTTNWDREHPHDYMLFGAGNGGSDRFLIGMREHNYGKVYYWCVGGPYLPPGHKYAPLLIANSFEEFLEGLSDDW